MRLNKDYLKCKSFTIYHIVATEGVYNEYYRLWLNTTEDYEYLKFDEQLEKLSADVKTFHKPIKQFDRKFLIRFCNYHFKTLYARMNKNCKREYVLLFNFNIKYKNKKFVRLSEYLDYTQEIEC